MEEAPVEHDNTPVVEQRLQPHRLGEIEPCKLLQEVCTRPTVGRRRIGPTPLARLGSDARQGGANRLYIKMPGCHAGPVHTIVEHYVVQVIDLANLGEAQPQVVVLGMPVSFTVPADSQILSARNITAGWQSGEDTARRRRHAVAPNGYELGADIVPFSYSRRTWPPSATSSAPLHGHELHLDAPRSGDIVGIHACDEWARQSAMPTLSAVTSPRLAVLSTRMRPSRAAQSRTMPAVPSVEPSSTRISSQLGKDCPSMLAIAASR